MIEIIISTIFLISPQDSTSIPFDITIVVDPPVPEKSIIVFLDGVEIKGERESDYFYQEIKSLPPGKHRLKANTNNELQEWGFVVTQKEENPPTIFSGNLSIGGQNSYYSDTLYSGETNGIFGGDFSLYRGGKSLSFSLYHDPDYPSIWYPHLSYAETSICLEIISENPWCDFKRKSQSIHRFPDHR